MRQVGPEIELILGSVEQPGTSVSYTTSASGFSVGLGDVF